MDVLTVALPVYNFGLNSLLPINLSPRYRSTNTAYSGSFGVGMSFALDWFAYRVSAIAVQVYNAGGADYLFTLQGDGMYRANDGRSQMLGAEIQDVGGTLILRTKDGSKMVFNAPTSNPSGRVSQVIDANGNTLSITPASSTYLYGVQSVVDAAGRAYGMQTESRTVAFNANNLLIVQVITKIIDPVGRSMSFTYDAQARMTSLTDADGKTTSFSYNAAFGPITSKSGPRPGQVTSYTYDQYFRVIQETLPSGAVWQFNYVGGPSAVTETQVIDPRGNPYTYRFGPYGYPTHLTDATGREFQYTRDPANNLLTSVTDNIGRTPAFQHDASGNVTRTTDAAGNVTQIDYHPQWNKPIRITNALGFVSTFAYDSAGNLQSSTNAEGETWTFAHNAKGLLTQVTDPLGASSTYTYDSDGNRLTSTNPLGKVHRSSYDNANRVEQSTDPRGAQTRYTYDALDRVRSSTDALGGVTSLDFDASSNLLQVVDARTNTPERNVYDLGNRLIERYDALNQVTRFAYDANNNLTQRIDRKGGVTQYTYDALNRLTSVSFADGRSRSLTYDTAGRLSQVVDSVSGTLTYTYDLLNQVTQVVTPQGTVGYAYDALGRRTSRTLNGGDATTYTHDRADRLTAVTFRGKTVLYHYNPAGQLQKKTLPDGSSENYSYDAAWQLTAIQYKKSDGSILDTLSHTHDDAGNRITRQAGSSGINESNLTNASYDSANRLIQYTNAAAQTVNLTYDFNGNLTSKVVAGLTTLYTWDAREQLTAINGPGLTASFKYDALGRRTEKTINGQTRQYLYDGAQAIAELTGGTVDTAYHTGGRLDEVLARYAGSGDRILLGDGLGSTLLQLDNSGAIKSSYRYSPYGETLVTGETGNPLTYTGREDDGAYLVQRQAAGSKVCFYYREDKDTPLFSDDTPDLHAATVVLRSQARTEGQTLA